MSVAWPAEIGVSRPLLHMHLQRLEAAGLIVGSLELSDDGKAMKYFELTDFDLHLTASSLAEAAGTLPVGPPEGPARKGCPDVPQRGNSVSWPESVALLGLLVFAMFLLVSRQRTGWSSERRRSRRPRMKPFGSW